MTEAYIFDAVRTARGKAKPTGGLADQRPIDLAAAVLRAIAERNRLAGDAADDVILGCVTQTGEQGANLGKIAALYAGWSPAVPGATVNRFCASGLEAVHNGAMQVMTGAAELVACGGVESMSRVAMFGDGGAWFADAEVARSTGFWHMGAAADLVANRLGIGRAELDAYAARSHRRAAAARDAGRFDDALIPVAGLTADELIRDQLDEARLATLEPAFADQPRPAGLDPDEPIEPRHTVGSSPGMCDAAALLLVGSAGAGRDRGLTPRARIAGWAAASVDPIEMLTGNVPAIRRALARAGIRPDQVDRYEINESFAVVPISCARELEIAGDRLNPCGGAISMGHPLGATGGILLATLLGELERSGGRWGVASVCGGAGVAAATVIERIGPNPL